MGLSERELFLQHLAPTSFEPRGLQITRAEGAYLFDAQGKAYLDFVSGFAVNNIGHGRPEIKEAINAQLDKHLHLTVYGEYIQSPQVAYAEALSNALGNGLDSIYFTNSGAEATEGAMKLAKRATGRKELVSFIGAYHGSTQGALSLMGDERYKRAFRPLLPGVKHLPYGAFEALERIGCRTAAVFVECIQAESGYIVPPHGWLQALASRCREMGALLVVDEAQTGFGRAGAQLFAFQSAGIQPDIVLMAKGIGGGMPLGAFAASKSLMDKLATNPILGHITTFGGHPLSCAAGLASLQIIQNEGLPQKATRIGAIISEELSGLGKENIKGAGAMWSIETRDFTQTLHITQALEVLPEMGIILDWFLLNEKALRLAPPLTIEEETLRRALNQIKRELSA
jgi:acetylornithine/succinyldiaminopimelate/putrescine aminotransferase